MNLSTVIQFVSFLIILYMPVRLVLGCNCSYDGDNCEVNSRIFNGEPFCDVNLLSSCPDLLIYTDCVDQQCSKRRVSAEACRESPNHFGFVRFEEKECGYDSSNELESFIGLNDSSISQQNARDECEEYCSRASGCWGCTFHCDNDCKWIAISECKEFKVNELGKGGTTQKPVCFDIKTINGESNQYEYETWNLGTCSKSFSGNQESPFDVYTSYDSAIQRCCLAPKNYDLTCHDSSDYHDGWNGGALEIFGHKYCDDFVDSIARRKLIVSTSISMENSTTAELAEINYLQVVGQKCKRLGIYLFSQDEAETACSTNEYCIGYMNTAFQDFPDMLSRDNGVFRLCFKRGNSHFWLAQNVDGSKNEQINIYKKEYQASTTNIELIPSAHLLSDSPNYYFTSSDYSCPNGAKPFQLTKSEREDYDEFVTCHCEDHCSWYNCKLLTPPSNCLEGTKNFWKWDEISNYWVAQMYQGNTGGNKENTSEDSMPVVDANVNFRETYSNNSSLEYYEIATVIVLCVVFLLFVFAYFGRTPRKICNNKTLISNTIKRIFTVLCGCLAAYMIMTQVVKYYENNDASSIHYKEFNKARENKYPTFSICIEGKDFYYKNFDDQLFENFGIDSLQYGNILKGQSGFVGNYIPEERLYEKIPKDFSYVSSVNFTFFSFKLSDVVAGIDLVAYNENDTKRYRDASIEYKIENFPFKKTFQTWKEQCFTRISNDPEQARRKYDLLSLDAETLKTKGFEGTQFKLIIHYPGQLMRSMHKPALSASFYDLNGAGTESEPKRRDIFIQQVTVLKKRTNSNQPCDERIVDDDAKFINEVIKKSGCSPVYLDSLISDESNYEKCQSEEQFHKVYQILNNYKDTLLSYKPPCVDMRVLVRDQQNEPLKNPHKEIDIKLIYNEGTYQEIVNTRDFGMDTFWISVGGFVGLFLGYSISHIPDLIAGIPDLFRKRNEVI